MDPQNPFLTPGNHEADHEDSQEVIAERAIADAGQSQALYNYNQKLLEQKERELMESIAMNYGRIRDVERELGNLQLQLKLTSGPKKHALELLRKKIEAQNEKVAYVRAKHTAAKATYERLDAELKTEEAVKEQLCGELNTLVQQAAKAQLDKLEELKATLEGLYSGYLPKQAGAQQQQQQHVAGGQAGPSGATAPGTATPPQQQQQQPQQAESGTSGSAAASQATAASTPTEAAEQQEQLRRRQEQERLEQERLEQERRAAEERRRREAEAAAARSRHVSLGSASGSSGGAVAAAGPTGRQAGQGAAGPGGAAAAARPKAANGGAAVPAAAAAAPAGTAQKQRFSGFDT